MPSDALRSCYDPPHEEGRAIDDPGSLPTRTDASEIEALVRDLGELARSAPKELAARIAALPLRQQAEVVLRLPAKERLELLLHAPQPMRLVRALPDAEIHLTVREVGPSDALPLLSLASADQIRHLIDLESWRGDRFDPERSGAWVALLLEAGEPTMLRFLRNAEDEILMLLFARFIRVRQIEIDDTPSIHGHGETEAGTEEGFLSPDGFHRFSPLVAEHAPAIRRIAEILFHDNTERYQRIVWGSLVELPSEVEEQALYWRQSRLEEHGFPTWDEALSVYAPPTGERARDTSASEPADDALLAPRAALRVDGAAELARAVDRLEAKAREIVLLGLTAVANRLLVADGIDTGDTLAQRDALRRAASTVSIALAARGAREDIAAARVLLEVSAVELFREGHARAAALRETALVLVKEGWPSVHPRALELLDGLLRSRLEGLLEKRPLYFCADPSGVERPYREFRSLEELEETALSLELADLVGAIAGDTLGWDLRAILDDIAETEQPRRFSALLATSLAWQAQTGELRGKPLPAGVASSFLRETSAVDRARASLDALVARLAAERSLEPRAASALAAFGRASLAALEEELPPPGAEPDPLAMSSLYCLV